jgi:hypothetical protein
LTEEKPKSTEVEQVKKAGEETKDEK